MRVLDRRDALSRREDILKDIAVFLQELDDEGVVFDLGDARDLGGGVAAMTLEEIGACIRAVIYLPHRYLDAETPYGRIVIGLIGRFARGGGFRRLVLDGIGDAEAARWARGRAWPGDVTPHVASSSSARRSMYFRAHRRRAIDPATGTGGMSMWMFDPPAGNA